MKKHNVSYPTEQVEPAAPSKTPGIWSKSSLSERLLFSKLRSVKESLPANTEMDRTAPGKDGANTETAPSLSFWTPATFSASNKEATTTVPATILMVMSAAPSMLPQGVSPESLEAERSSFELTAQNASVEDTEKDEDRGETESKCQTEGEKGL
ncbi:hypothetical protein AOLI_G00205260 [Acnodon oligacanthus]